ncbi:MAG: DUF2961 domain-containing protein [Clostridiales bacterium]|nr:DUF2961 domain-containing protein [Clostridiales bacterium]
MDMRNLSKITLAQTRSVSPENITGEKGMGGRTPLEEGSARHAARDLGTGWKVNPYFRVAPGETITLADVTGEGAINHIWMTPTGSWRMQILRFYWDGETEPTIECPMGDFFASPWGKYKQISSLAVCVNPGCAFNSYFRMPFKKGFRVTLENLTDEMVNIYYQITYSLEKIDPNEGYFHAQFRRVNPLPYKGVYTILDKIEGRGQYVGTSMGWGVNNDGWWGEGEIKFYMDGDKDFPTICGTGTEDYFCGSYNFENPYTHDRYEQFTTPYAGMNVHEPDHLYRSRARFSLYRWHITDPIRFEKDLSVTIQALGWRSGGRYLPLQDDISSVAYFYLDKPVCKRPALLDKDALEII